MASRMKASDKQAANKKEVQRTPASSTGGKKSTSGKANSSSGAPHAANGNATHKDKVPSGAGGSKANGSLRGGSKRRSQTQHDGKSAAILSAGVFVLCMACLAAGFYLSSPAPQRDELTGVWLPPPDQDSSSQSVAENQLPPVEQTPTEPAPLSAASPSPVLKADSEDSFVPNPPSGMAGDATDVAEAQGAPSEVKPSVPAVEHNQAVSSAVSTGANTQLTQEAGQQKESAPFPVKADEGSGFDIPPAQNGAVLVFIIDDGGYSTAHLEKYTSLPFPVAVAVLPRLAHSVECAQIVRSSGQELMLHQPMQAKNLSVYPGEGALLPSMSAAEIYDTVMANLREIAPVRGMNNHEGSLITADAAKLSAVLDATKDAGVYFLDSRTSADTVAPQVAEQKGMRILQRDVFIDDIISEDEMLKQILRGLDIANKNGQVVMIAHVDKSAAILPSLLKRMHPELVRQGYAFAFPSELLH